MLFVGPSESGLMLDHGLVPMKAPLAFAFRKATAADTAQAPVMAPPSAHRQGTSPAETPPRPQQEPAAAASAALNEETPR